MNIFEFTLLNITSFLLILTRISTIIFIMPFFGSRNIPTMVKIALSFILSFILFPVVKSEVIVPANIFIYLSLIIKEIAVGLIIGFVCLLIFASAQLGGHLVDIQMGYAIMNIVDTQQGIQISLIGQFCYILMTLVLLVVNAHHLIISALFQSFEIVPLSTFTLSNILRDGILRFSSDMFIIALKIAAPAFAVIFLAEVAMGFIARTVPQMNIFLVGFPLRIALGLFMLSISIPFLVYFSKILMSEMHRNMLTVLRAM